MNIEKATLFDIVEFGTVEDLYAKLLSEKKELKEVIDLTDTSGASLLELSLSYGNFKVAMEIIKLNPKVNVITKDGNNEFHIISARMRQKGAYDIAYRLLDKGVSLSQQDKKYGNTALFSFCYDINEFTDGQKIDFLKECFIKTDIATIDKCNKVGYSVKSVICDRGPYVLKKIVCNLNIVSDDNSYFSIIQNGTIEDLYKEIQLKNDSINSIVNLVNRDGISILEYSLAFKKFDIAIELLKYKPKVNVITKDNWNEFHFIVPYIKNKLVYPIAYKLLDREVQLTLQEKKGGNTPLHLFCYNINDDIQNEMIDFLKVCFTKVKSTTFEIQNFAGYSIKDLIYQRGSIELKDFLKGLM